jgi:predicted histidine transporter YuiF (NhaC family)
MITEQEQLTHCRKDKENKGVAVAGAIVALVVCLIAQSVYYFYEINEAKKLIATGFGTSGSNPQFQQLLRMTGTDTAIASGWVTFLAQQLWMSALVMLAVGLIVRWVGKPKS